MNLIKRKVNFGRNPLAANLLTESAHASAILSDISKEGSIIYGLSVRKSGVAVAAIGELSTFEAGPAQVGIDQGSVVKNSSTQVSPTQFSTFQRGATQLGSTEISFTEVSSNQPSQSQRGVSQVGIIHDSFEQISSAQVGSTQIGITQTGFKQISPTQVSVLEARMSHVPFSQIDANQNSTGQISTRQLSPSEFSVLSSVLSEQFLTTLNVFHVSPPIATINNSVVTLWNTLLQTRTPFDINLIVKDLPTGQLAETQITEFDGQGRPKGGTLLIDHDANGLGWFIDPTPFEHSEFSQTLKPTRSPSLNYCS